MCVLSFLLGSFKEHVKNVSQHVNCGSHSALTILFGTVYKSSPTTESINLHAVYARMISAPTSINFFPLYNNARTTTPAAMDLPDPPAGDFGGGCGWKGWIWKGALGGGGFCLTTASPSTVSLFSCLAPILSGRNAFRATFVHNTRTGSHSMQGAGTCHSRLTTTGSKASTPTRVWSSIPSLDRPYMLLGALCPSGGEPSAQPGEK